MKTTDSKSIFVLLFAVTSEIIIVFWPINLLGCYTMVTCT